MQASTGLMTAVDLTIIVATIAAIVVFLRNRHALRSLGLQTGGGLVLFGLGLIGLFFVLDLSGMWILPRVLGEGSAQAAVERLQLQYSWVFRLVGIVSVCAGFLLALRKTVGFVDRLQRANHALMDSEQRFRSVFEQASAGMTVLGPDGRFRYMNPAAERILGYSSAEIAGRTPLDLVHPSERAEVEERMIPLVEGTLPVSQAERRVRRGDGRTIWCHIATTAVRGQSGRPLELISILHDITDRKRLEAEVLDVASQERERLGRDLHDVLGQELTGISLLARALELQLEERGTPEAREAREIGALVDAALARTRFMAQGLFPDAVGSGNLSSALADLARSARQLFSVDIVLETRGDPRVTDREAQNLYQIARESLTNAVRHGRARHLRIVVEASGMDVRMTVEDDGVGIPPPAERNERVGLRSMRHRSVEIGAALSIERGPRGGTVVTCALPGQVAGPQLTPLPR